MIAVDEAMSVKSSLYVTCMYIVQCCTYMHDCILDIWLNESNNAWNSWKLAIITCTFKHECIIVAEARNCMKQLEAGYMYI